MGKNKGLYYVFAALVIIVIIGVIFFSQERQPSRTADQSGSIESLPAPKIPAANNTAPSQISPASISEPSKSTNLDQKEPSASTDTDLSISGNVSLSDGSLAPEATIRIIKTENPEENLSDESLLSSVTADKNGNYAVSVANQPIIFVKASFPGYATLTAVAGRFAHRPNVKIIDGKQEHTINFTLPPASHIKGRVIDEKNNPIAGASVTTTQINPQSMENFSIEKTVTDSEGRF
ncbi:carboxypeptidase regulatory-like domain-containing protein, partial [Candidatus Sumerlaeota bacterium]|nr:carboxypeptidase regulatory-like domain-containing protein [Candidatus Sumerlaeota bacterium]